MEEKRKMIRTPIHHIPIGEPVKCAGGQYGLRIKKPNGSEVEEISIESLFEMIIKVTSTRQ